MTCRCGMFAVCPSPMSCDERDNMALAVPLRIRKKQEQEQNEKQKQKERIVWSFTPAPGQPQSQVVVPYQSSSNHHTSSMQPVLA